MLMVLRNLQNRDSIGYLYVVRVVNRPSYHHTDLCANVFGGTDGIVKSLKNCLWI